MIEPNWYSGNGGVANRLLTAGMNQTERYWRDKISCCIQYGGDGDGGAVENKGREADK